MSLTPLCITGFFVCCSGASLGGKAHWRRGCAARPSAALGPVSLWHSGCEPKLARLFSMMEKCALNSIIHMFVGSLLTC